MMAIKFFKLAVILICLLLAASMLVQGGWLGGFLLLMAGAVLSDRVLTLLRDKFYIQLTGNLVGLAFMLFFFFGVGLGSSEVADKNKEKEVATEAAEKQKHAERAARMKAEFDSKRQQIEAAVVSALKTNDIDGAKKAIAPYVVSNAPDVIAVKKKIELVELKQRVKGATDIAEKKNLYAQIVFIDPSDVESKRLHDKYSAKLQAQYQEQEKARERALAEVAREEKRKKKQSGVYIGMTMQDVLDSSWGKPRHVNKTTTAYGTSEQWVYDGGYLYFDDGILRTIQN